MKIRNKVTALIVTGVLAAGMISACGISEDATNSSANNVSASSPADANESKTEITLGYLPITHALAIFEEKQLLEEENADISIKLEKFSSWSDLTDALNSGSIDGASVLIELAMSAKSKGIDLKAVALGHKDGNVIIGSNNIQSAADLKGKTVAIPSTQSSHNILMQDALAKAELTLDDIKVIQLAPSEMPSALAGGSIDAYCVAEPFGAQAVAQGFGHVLFESKELWEDSLCCGLVLNESAIERLGDKQVNTLIEKYYEAGKNLDENEAKKIAESYLGQDEKVLETSLKWIHYDDLVITEEAYGALCEKVIEYKIDANPPAYSEFVYRPK